MSLTVTETLVSSTTVRHSNTLQFSYRVLVLLHEATVQNDDQLTAVTHLVIVTLARKRRPDVQQPDNTTYVSRCLEDRTLEMEVFLMASSCSIFRGSPATADIASDRGWEGLLCRYRV